MRLIKLLVLKKSIEEHRDAMYELVKEKGLSDPKIIKVSQQLDKKILEWQKMFTMKKNLKQSQLISQKRTDLQ